MQEESEAERLSKAQCIKKNVKKIREEKRKTTKEVAKSKVKLPEKKKQIKEAAKQSTLKIKDAETGEGSKTPANPWIKRSEKGKEKMVEEPPNEAGKGRKKQFSNLLLEMGFFP